MIGLTGLVWRLSLRALALLFAFGSATAAADLPQPERVRIDSLDRAHGQPVQLPGFWFAGVGADAASAAPRPAAVLLHGCGGAYQPGGAASGALSAQILRYAHWLQARGVSALVLDSLTPRGETSLCAQAMNQRRVNQSHRRRDALAALRWLATQPGVDAQRLGLIGWSHGASTVLAALNLKHPEVQASAVRAAFAVAFYPGCSAELQRGLQASGPLLLLLGAADDWTPAAPCLDLAARAEPPTPVTELYADAHHGFDSLSPLRLRSDVPNGVNPGAGVHVGGQAQARGAAMAALARFLAQQGATMP